MANNFRIFIIGLIVVTFLFGCGQATPLAPVKTFSPTMDVAPTSALPTAQPTETPVPATSTPMPTVAPTATPTATASLVPTQTQAPSATLSPTTTQTLTATPTMVSSTGSSAWTGSVSADHLKIYFIQLKTGGSVACGDSAIAVDSGITRTGNIGQDIRAALKRLFSYKDQHPFGLYNPLYLSNIAVLGVDANTNGGATNVYLAGTYKPTGADCDNLRVKAQVWSTVRQFKDVHFLNIYINGRPFGDQVSNDK